MTAREALLQAFDRLFDVAAQKLNVVCTPEERAEAKEQFAARFEHALGIAQKVETLYLVALSRAPRPDELDRMVRYVSTGGGRGDEAHAYADVLWVLLNSAEFAMNH